jgi:hypothetical protein
MPHGNHVCGIFAFRAAQAIEPHDGFLPSEMTAHLRFFRGECPSWVILDQVIELGLRADVRFDPESNQNRAATQYVAKGQGTKSLRSG